MDSNTDNGTNQELYGYVGTLRQTHKTGEIVYADDGTPYRAIADSQRDRGTYQTPVARLPQQEEDWLRRPSIYEENKTSSEQENLERKDR